MIPPQLPAQVDDPGYVQGDYTNASLIGYNGAVGLAPDSDAIASGACAPPCLNGHVDPRPIMDVGVMNGNMPAPLMAIDEDDEFFLTLTNVGQVMRPDLFEQHTVHFHGYPNASAFYDGVPDASVAINIGGSFTYYYLAPDAGTYFWHCHITPPEHLQMGMVGQIYVRPRQNRVPAGDAPLSARSVAQQSEICARSAIPTTSCAAIHCRPRRQRSTAAVLRPTRRTKTMPTTTVTARPPTTSSIRSRCTASIPNFHFVGMTFNPENFTDMKDKYFLLNGRSYPDTVTRGPARDADDGWQRCTTRSRCPRSSTFRPGQKALLRISDLDITEFQTLASLGIPMKVIGINAKLLRDQAGNNLYYNTNSITLGGGESVDVILDQHRRFRRAGLLPLHAQSRPPVERRRELRRADDRSPGHSLRRAAMSATEHEARRFP